MAYRPVGVDEDWNFRSEVREALAGSPELSAALGPDGTAGNISKQTAQGVALVQALIFGGN